MNEINFKRLHKIARQKSEDSIRAALAELVVYKQELLAFHDCTTRATRLVLAQCEFAQSALVKGLARIERDRRLRTLARSNSKIRRSLLKKQLEQKMFEQTAKALVTDALRTAKA